jgi:hypothetical protein
MEQYKDVLDWVNRARAEYNIGGGEPLDALPMGARHRAGECPIALALGGRGSVMVLPSGICFECVDKWVYPPPEYVQQFIRAFDRGEIPELDVDAPCR